MKCKNCKTTNPARAKFCRHCGTRFGGVNAVAQPPPQPGSATKVFTWIGYIVAGLFVLGLLSGF